MEILPKVLCSSLCLLFLEIFLVEGAKLPTPPKSSDSIRLCAKYRNEPKSGWSSLPKKCRHYLQSLEGASSTAEPSTGSHRIPLNIGEREVEIEVEKEGNNIEKEVEIENEKENEKEKEIEVESESDYKCRGSKCMTEGATGEKGGTNGKPSSGFNEELLRIIALLGMAVVIGVTVVVIAVLLICLVRRNGASSQPSEGRKDYSRNVIRDHDNGAVEQPAGRHHRPQYNDASTVSSSSRGRHQQQGLPRENTPGQDRTRDWLRDQTNGSEERSQSGRSHRPQYKDASTVSSSSRGRQPHRSVPTDSTPGYSLVDDSQYASIEEGASETTSASGRGGHYYFKLESDKDSYPPLSSVSSKWTSSASERSSTPSDKVSRKSSPRSKDLPQSCSESNKSIGSIPIELTVQSQYDHLDHSGSHSRAPSKGSTGTSLRYDVLSRKE